MTASHQATCVAIDGRAILIEGPPACGKSSLALALIDRGAKLIGDDSVVLELCAGQVLARPHPNTRGLLEVRNVGLVTMPVLEGAPVAIVQRLDSAAPRFIEKAQSCTLLEQVLPMISLFPDSPVLALRSEIALERYGLKTT